MWSHSLDLVLHQSRLKRKTTNVVEIVTSLWFEI